MYRVHILTVQLQQVLRSNTQKRGVEGSTEEQPKTIHLYDIGAKSQLIPRALGKHSELIIVGICVAMLK